MLTRDENALQAVRRRHELRVIESVISHGNRTRKELESDTKLSRTTLSAIVGDLRQRGVLNETDQDDYGTGRNGRPTKILALNPQAGASVGIELGRRRVSISLMGFDGSRLDSEHRELAAPMELQQKVQLAASMLASMVQDGRIVPDLVVGAGVGIASRHADQHSLADGAQRQSNPEGATLDPLRKELHVPFLWDNNIRLAAVAQRSGADVLMYVVLSTGISSAVVVNGSLLRGGHGVAGELGHISVDFQGPQCWCGRRGCLEQLLNEGNVLLEASRRGQAFESIEAMAAAASAGNPIAGGIVDWAGEMLARALGSACVLLDPNRVVIAGELAQFGERLLVPVREALTAQDLNIGPRTTSIETAEFSPTAGSDGAALAALKRWALTVL